MQGTQYMDWPSAQPLYCISKQVPLPLLMVSYNISILKRKVIIHCARALMHSCRWRGKRWRNTAITFHIARNTEFMITDSINLMARQLVDETMARIILSSYSRVTWDNASGSSNHAKVEVQFSEHFYSCIAQSVTTAIVQPIQQSSLPGGTVWHIYAGVTLC